MYTCIVHKMSVVKWSCIIVVIAATLTALKSKFQQQLPVVVGGTFHPAFKPLADLFRQQVESGKERGGTFAVYHHGDLVFDMWGGYADEESRRPWQQNTMTMSFSVSKGIVATVIASLVDKGLVDYRRPVVDYWPEFGQHDKSNITVEMLLSHQAGIPVLDETINIRDILENPTKVHDILAAQKTFWPAGTKMGYHVVTYGLYADALVQKIDPNGRGSMEVFSQDIATQFGIDAYMNCPKEQFHRTAKIYTDSKLQQLVDSLLSIKYFSAFWHMILNPDSFLARSTHTVEEVKLDIGPMNNPDVREVTISSSSVTGTARALAKLYGILANGGRLGNRALLNATTLAALSEPLVTGTDEVTTMTNITYGRGMWFLKNPKGQMTFGHPGHGGQVTFADPANNIGFAYLTNFVSIYAAGDDPRFVSLQKVLYECLDVYTRS